ncbi:hypothetical protein IST4119_05260 [Burkholderia multivorans]|nr:hypothetical protein IST4119_05260 [Burkholderia multivorans]
MSAIELADRLDRALVDSHRFTIGKIGRRVGQDAPQECLGRRVGHLAFGQRLGSDHERVPCGDGDAELAFDSRRVELRAV